MKARQPDRHSGAIRRGLVAVLATCAALLLSQLPASAVDLVHTPRPVTGNATDFDGLGTPHGGCGLPQENLDSQDFVALNVFNTPGDNGNYSRPLPASLADKLGMFDNGFNCGRWIRVTLGDICTATPSAAQNQPSCGNGSRVNDAYSGATLNMLVADSCADQNMWCRDDPYHLDLHKNSLSRFTKNGAPMVGMYPGHFNNRHVNWQFIPAPNYTGDIQIGFMQNAQKSWGAIAVSHLPTASTGCSTSPMAPGTRRPWTATWGRRMSCPRPRPEVPSSRFAWLTPRTS